MEQWEGLDPSRRRRGSRPKSSSRPEMVNKILTWNVNGLNSAQKRRKIFHYLRQFKNDVVCLQETHIRKVDEKYLINQRLGTHFIASSKVKKNGIVIYVKKDLRAKLVEADDSGRYIAIEYFANGLKTLLVGLYAPNQQQEKFYKLLFEKISTWDYKSMILLGDWNGVIDIVKDKKLPSRKLPSHAKLPKAFFDMLDFFELRDVWRIYNLQEKDYTFFSDRHKSYSRIDFILATPDLLSMVKKIRICPRILSDHSPVWMELYQLPAKKRGWRMNENLFKYENNVKQLKNQLKEFFDFNLNKGTSIDVVWEASKAYMRGNLIYMNNRQKVNKLKQQKYLEQEIWKKQQLLIHNPDDVKLKEIIKILQAQFNMIIADQVATNIQFAKHNTFCNSNKPGRWLSYLLRKRQKARNIESIEYKGEKIFQQEKLKRAFLEFYMDLYAKEKIQDKEIDDYLIKCSIKPLTEEQRGGLNRPITTEEILFSVQDLKVGKSPGTDGFTSTYYKKLVEEMVEPLKDLFNSIQVGGGIPESWRSAYISLIPKQDQDNIKMTNYRPISLLNTDYKIFAKILASRLMVVLQQRVHSDQSGFIKGRYMRNNIRQIVDLLEFLERNNQIQGAFLFVDAEKAFDRLHWGFLMDLIDKMQCGEMFCTTIKALYKDQSAQIIVNGDVTEAFKIEKGTRQGCPLSPLLFILTLEPLLDMVRASNEIQGIKIRKYEYKLKAFADDLVFILTQPIKSIRTLLDLLKGYGQVSGFKINIAKTKLLTKNMDSHAKRDLEELTGFEIVKKFKYLGVYVASSNAKLFKNNYEILWQEVKKEMDKWGKLQLSLLGRIAAIKMNVLPKFLFLFQMIPVIKKDETLELWQSQINKFVWAGKKARVKMKIIQDVRERGGLKMPNFKLYYEATVLTIISDWFNLTEERTLNIESFDLLYGWHAYLLYDKKVDKTFRNHVLRSSLLRVWKKYQHKLNYKIPMWASPGHTIENINIQQSQDSITYENLLYKEKTGLQFKPLSRLKEEGFSYTWFQYAQLRNRWAQDQKVGIMHKEENLVKQIRNQAQAQIRRLYNALIEIDSEAELVKDCMVKWAQNIQAPIMLETWEKIWVRNVKFTQAQNLRENFYKMFYRWHLDPKKLSCMYSDMQPKCWRCDCTDATYFHIWWTCKKIKAFWIKVWWVTQNILKKRIKFAPELFLLGIINDFTSIETKLILNLITAARLLIAQYWKKDQIPTIDQWLLKVSNLAEMAKISAFLKDNSQQKYLKEWKLWIEYIQNRHQIKNYMFVFE